ncbi:hypothetical protein F8388_012092 [Cannabis sativa]|uniref:Uncharacterized protein n=1 Tax=Cannabis sativa TaxID=3483 RepID=A0A7J6GFW3_CANSA|nr:hypothetical protein G4B88_020499 [Cannabis sativa]KAF4381170.1 hypothetical protein F8388_012092 [Cannabis sativa]
MDIPGKNRARHRPSTSTERFLVGAFSHSPSDNAVTSTSAGDGDELNEDDIFWTGDFSAESNHNNISASPSSTSASRVLNNNRLLQPKGFAAQPEGFGILAALPENETSSPKLRDHSNFYNKASISSSSSSSSSSSRLIPVIPKPPQERIMPVPSSSALMIFDSNEAKELTIKLVELNSAVVEYYSSFVLLDFKMYAMQLDCGDSRWGQQSPILLHLTGLDIFWLTYVTALKINVSFISLIQPYIATGNVSYLFRRQLK